MRSFHISWMLVPHRWQSSHCALPSFLSDHVWWQVLHMWVNGKETSRWGFGQALEKKNEFSRVWWVFCLFYFIPQVARSTSWKLHWPLDHSYGRVWVEWEVNLCSAKPLTGFIRYLSLEWSTPTRIAVSRHCDAEDSVTGQSGEHLVLLARLTITMWASQGQATLAHPWYFTLVVAIFPGSLIWNVS